MIALPYSRILFLLAAFLLVLLVRAPLAFAQGYADGQSCTPNRASMECESGYCNTSGICETPPRATVGPGQASPGTQGQVGPSQTPGASRGPSVTLLNPLGEGTTLNSLLVDILKFVVRIGSIVVIFMLVYVGFKFVIARGNPTAIEEARNALLWTVIGALILLGAQSIALGIQATVKALSVGQ